MCRRGCQAGCSLFWNFVYLFMGLIMLAVGVWYPVDDFIFDTAVMDNPEQARSDIQWRGWVGGLLAVGGYSVLVGILGMAASGCQSKGALIAFLVFGSFGVIACIVIAGIASASFATDMVKNANNDDSELASILTQNLKNNYFDENATDAFTTAWNNYQARLSCCGVTDFRDYVGSAFANDTEDGYMVPWTCCLMNKDRWSDVDIEHVINLEGCRAEAENPPMDNVFEFLEPEGCKDDIIWRYRFDDIMVMGIGWGVVFFQIIALIVAGCLKEDLKIGTWTV